jgi:hypothetical protein
MKRNSIFMAWIPAVLLVFGLVLAGCPTDGGDDDGKGGGGGSELSITGISDAPPIRYYVAGQTPRPVGGKIFAVAAEKPPSTYLDISPDGYKGVPSQTGTMKFKVFVYDTNSPQTPASEFTGSVTIPAGDFTFWYGTTAMINPDNSESCDTKAAIVFTDGKGEITYVNSGLADD